MKCLEKRWKINKNLPSVNIHIKKTDFLWILVITDCEYIHTSMVYRKMPMEFTADTSLVLFGKCMKKLNKSSTCGWTSHSCLIFIFIMNPSYTTRKEVFWRFSGVFRIYKMGRLARNGLWKCLQLVKVGYNKVKILFWVVYW